MVLSALVKKADSVTMDGISESEVPFLFFKAEDRVQGLFTSKLWFLGDSTMSLWYYSTTT